MGVDVDLGLFLNYDPSHPTWLGIDPLFAIDNYADRILHVHAKDIELFPSKRNRYGWLGKVVKREDSWDVGWWRYRIPGRGESIRADSSIGCSNVDTTQP